LKNATSVQGCRKLTSLSRYRGGITTYLEVLDGQRSLYDSELTLAQARGSEYQSLVQLYKALGGGWMQASQPSTPRIP
jgi:multidrug efflux system outer membrane protein